MTLMESKPARIGAILLLLASQCAAQKAADLKAVLTRLEGSVTLSSASRSEFRSVRIAAQRQILRQGDAIHVPSGAQATLACSTDTLVSLTGPADWVLDTAACRRGLPLPGGSYQHLGSYAGRILPRNGALLLELDTRSVEAGSGPILLSPRYTAVLDNYPRLIWSRVPEAAEYQIEIRGQARAVIRLPADDLQCGPGSGSWQSIDICSWPASGRWPPLEPDRSVQLRLGFRQAMNGVLREVGEIYEIRLVSANEQYSIQEKLRQIVLLPLDETSRLLLSAGVYAESELYTNAIPAYTEALQAQEMPEARVTLGDLYLKIGLTALAEREFRQVLEGTPDAAAQAAAELGLAYVAYARKRFSEAHAQFERAGDLYAKLGLPEEAAAARAAAARSKPSV